MPGFASSRALEKFLKAYLLSRGWKLRRIHDLDTLLEYAADFDPSLGRYRDIVIDITDFYMAERYPPFRESKITEDEISRALECTADLVAHLRENCR